VQQYLAVRFRTLALVVVAVCNLVATHPADAQPAARTWRIGFLSLVAEDLEQYKPWLAAFRDGLRQLGYVEGQNLVLEQRYAAGRIDRLPALAAELAIEQRLPTSGSHRGWAEGGLLMSYGTDFVAMFRHGAVVVDKILKGASPATLPVEQPTKFELVINAKTAKAIGLAIPPSVLVRADALIQ